MAEAKTAGERPAEEAAKFFAVLSDPTRLRLLKLLLRQDESKPLCVRALARRLDISQPAVSQHLRIMKDAGLVRGVRRGPEVHYYLDPDALERARNMTAELLTVTADGEVCREQC